MFEEHDVVILTNDIPEHGLKAGDVGTIVAVLGDGAAFLIEFMTLGGHTLAVVEIPPSQVRPITDRDMDHARQIDVPA